MILFMLVSLFVDVVWLGRCWGLGVRPTPFGFPPEQRLKLKQDSTVQYSAVQYSTVLLSTAEEY